MFCECFCLPSHLLAHNIVSCMSALSSCCCRTSASRRTAACASLSASILRAAAAASAALDAAAASDAANCACSEARSFASSRRRFSSLRARSALLAASYVHDGERVRPARGLHKCRGGCMPVHGAVWARGAAQPQGTGLRRRWRKDPHGRQCHCNLTAAAGASGQAPLRRPAAGAACTTTRQTRTHSLTAPARPAPPSAARALPPPLPQPPRRQPHSVPPARVPPGGLPPPPLPRRAQRRRGLTPAHAQTEGAPVVAVRAWAGAATAERMGSVRLRLHTSVTCGGAPRACCAAS